MGTSYLSAQHSAGAMVAFYFGEVAERIVASLWHSRCYPLRKLRCHARRYRSLPPQLVHGGAKVRRVGAVAVGEWGVAFPLPAAVDADLAGEVGNAVDHSRETEMVDGSAPPQAAPNP